MVRARYNTRCIREGNPLRKLGSENDARLGYYFLFVFDRCLSTAVDEAHVSLQQHAP
jgi:hypothetical protein